MRVSFSLFLLSFSLSLCRSHTLICFQSLLSCRLPKRIKNNKLQNLNSFACKMKLTHTHTQTQNRICTFHDVRFVAFKWIVCTQVFSINVYHALLSIFEYIRVYKMRQNIHKIIRSGALTLHARGYIPFIR